MRSPLRSLTSWSFSRFSVYDQCPAKAKYAFIDKIKEPPNSAMDRGNEIHKMAEAYIKGEGRYVPKELKLVDTELKAMRAAKKHDDTSVVVETTWAFTQDWKVTTWDDWRGCALRVKVDVAQLVGQNVLIITDWKTGKFRPDRHQEYMNQIELYALGGLKYYGSQVATIRPRLIYTDQGQIYPDDGQLVYSHKDVPRLQKSWEARTKPMLKDTTFAPKPSNLCRWCHYRKENGGPCKF